MATKMYTNQYAGLLADVFKKKQHFLNTFGGRLQTKDGETFNDEFLKLKISDTDVVIQKYDMGENVAFGTGTGNSSRFGNRKEIKSVDKTIPYEAPLAIHEGVDKMTVNDNADQIIAERAGLHAEAWTEELNKLLSKVISDNASETLTGAMKEDDIVKAFNDAHKKFINNHVSKDIAWTAYVNPDVYAILIDSKIATVAKHSGADVDNHNLFKFKGFNIVELPEEYFQKGEQIYFAADNVGVVGIGIEVYRLIDSHDFNGVAIQSAAKYGKFIPEKNKKAIIKAKLTPAV